MSIGMTEFMAKSEGEGLYSPPLDLTYNYIPKRPGKLRVSETKVKGTVNSKPVSLSVANVGDPKKLANWWYEHRDDKHEGDIGVADLKVIQDVVWPLLALSYMIVDNPGGGYRVGFNRDRLALVDAQINSRLIAFLGNMDGFLYQNMDRLWVMSDMQLKLDERVVFDHKSG